MTLREKGHRILEGQLLTWARYPYSTMRSAFRNMLTSALIIAFLLPPGEEYFLQNNYRRGWIILGFSLLIWTACSATLFFRYRRYAYSIYDSSMMLVGGGPKRRLSDTIRWLAVAVAALSWVTFGLTNFPGLSRIIHEEHVSLASILYFILFLLFSLSLSTALGLSVYLRVRARPTDAQRVEEARRTGEDLRTLERKLAGKGENLADVLERKIEEIISELQDLRKDLESQRSKNELVSGELSSRVKYLLKDVLDIEARRDLRRQWNFAIVGLFLGLIAGVIASWISQPILALFHHPHL